MDSRHRGKPYLLILTTNNEVYYCGERDDFDQNGSISTSNPSGGKGIQIAIA